MDVIADFEAYPEWTGSIKNVEVTDPGPNGARAQRVRFSMDAGLIKDTYELAYTLGARRPVGVLGPGLGQLQKAQQGSYVLSHRPARRRPRSPTPRRDSDVPLIGRCVARPNGRSWTPR